MQDKYRQANGQVSMQKFITDAPEGMDLHFPFLRQEVEIDCWVRMLTAAMVWSVTGTDKSGSDWEGAWVWSPSYFPARMGIPYSMDDFLPTMERILYIWR